MSHQFLLFSAVMTIALAPLATAPLKNMAIPTSLVKPRAETVSKPWATPGGVPPVIYPLGSIDQEFTDLKATAPELAQVKNSRVDAAPSEARLAVASYPTRVARVASAETATTSDPAAKPQPVSPSSLPLPAALGPIEQQMPLIATNVPDFALLGLFLIGLARVMRVRWNR